MNKFVSIILFFLIQKTIIAQDYTLEKLPNLLNSAYNEITPVLSRDGKTIYFTRVGYPDFDRTLFLNREDISTRLSAGEYQNALASIYGEIGGRVIYHPEQSDFNQEVWIGEGDSSSFQTVSHPSFPLNNALPNSIVAITPDPNAFYIINQFKMEGGMDKGFSLIRRLPDGGWSFPEPVTIKDYYTITSDVSLTMSFDGEILILSAARFDSRDMDLYVCFKEGENLWSRPKHLGNTLNSERRETTPYLSEDNTTLFFSSNRGGTSGGNDIFMSRRSDDTWVNWSEPVRLTAPINSSSDDSQPYFNMTSGYLYFTSRRDGNSDIFRVQIAPPQPTEIVLKGRVINGQTGLLMSDSRIYYGAMGGPKNALISTDGYYTLRIPKGVKFELTPSKSSYTGKTEEVSFRRDYYYFQDYYVVDLVLEPSVTSVPDTMLVFPDAETEKTAPQEGIAAQTELPLMLEVNKKIELRPIYFQQSKAEILANSFEELNRLAEILQLHPTLEIRIEGHTDNNGKEKDLLRLSEERALSVKKFLINKGIAERRIKSIGYGSQYPINDNTSDEFRQKNRRVEFRITKI